MSFDAAVVLEQLERLERQAPPARRYVIAFSGGVDSTVLLHALATTRDRHRRPLVAVHVDHGLQPASAHWSERCAAIAARESVEFSARPVRVDTASGRGLEAAAREARYAALASHMAAGDWLLSAHHRDDQAETLLINLLRGSGPAGIAAIPRLREFAPGWLARPLLDVPRSDLERWADACGLDRVEDPTNADLRFDRNFLRHEIMPRLASRWGDVGARLAASAELARDSATLLEQLGDIDLDTGAGTAADRIALDRLEPLSASRQRNALRTALKRAGLPPPSAAQLDAIVNEVIAAREDAQPEVRWPGASVRRFGGRLYLGPGPPPDPPPGALGFRGGRIDLGRLGTLVTVDGASVGLDPALIAGGLEVRFRRGGETIRPAGETHRRKLKKLLQEAAVVPWMRDRLPLVFAGGRLVAVAGVCYAHDATTSPGTAIQWRDAPPIL